MLRVYQALLYLYPAAYRIEFGDEMACVFLQAAGDLELGFLRRASFYAHEFSGLVFGAAQARLNVVFGFHDWLPFRRFDMRPGFKFPRSTVFLMCLILAGVVVAIEKAKDITSKYGPPHAVAVGVSLPWFLLFALATAAVFVAATWGILFALHRTGMQRLDNVETWAQQR